VNRADRRLSRILIAILVVSVALGIWSFGSKLAHNSNPVADAVPAAVPLAAKSPDAAADLTPTTQPAAPPAVAWTPPPILPATPASIETQVDSPATQPDKSADEKNALSASATILGPTTLPSADLLTVAKQKIADGNILDAREQLNDALQTGQLDPDQADSIKAMLSQISQTLIFSKTHFPDDPYGGTYVVKSGDSLAGIARDCDTTWELLSRINGIDPRHLREGATIKIVQGPFFAVVDKRQFTMDIYLGGLPGEKSSMYVMTYGVGLGQDDSTPTGTWIVEPHRKLKHPTYYSPRGEGIIAADDPKNPLGGFWIGITGTTGQAVGKFSYGIHGTIDPDSIGKQSSLGCIRLKKEDIAVVFDLMVEGKSLVVVKD
jgi:lipoprotein-anchoring transpeptidase ErfK/SrfK